MIYDSKGNTDFRKQVIIKENNMEELMLQTRNLCKTFKKQKAVNGVSLNIVKGSVYGLLGPNGAGKSTTLKMITGII